MEFSDFTAQFRKSMDAAKPADPDLAAKWESRLGQQYEGMAHSEAFKDFRNNLITLRERFVESLLLEDNDGVRQSITILDTILKMASVRIEQGREAREALGEGEYE